MYVGFMIPFCSWPHLIRPKNMRGFSAENGGCRVWRTWIKWRYCRIKLKPNLTLLLSQSSLCLNFLLGVISVYQVSHFTFCLHVCDTLHHHFETELKIRCNVSKVTFDKKNANRMQNGTPLVSTDNMKRSWSKMRNVIKKYWIKRDSRIFYVELRDAFNTGRQ